MTTRTIGMLARAAGVNIETIRYYQRRGLIATPPRPPGSVRRYPPDALQQLRFIRRAQQLGFSLREIRELLKLGKGHCSDTRQIAEKHLQDVEARMQDLRQMRQTLRTLIRACTAGREASCPIVEVLTRESPPAKKLPRSTRRATVRRST